jgi:hypothetical protein
MLLADKVYEPETEIMMTFGHFVGSWDLDAVFFSRDGSRTTSKGEWHFGWILGGRGIQDIIFPVGASPHEYGTTIRCYDSTTQAWRATFMMPVFQEFANIVFRRSGNNLVGELEGLPRGQQIRWVFSEITPTSFLWYDEESLDDGKTWFRRQEMRGRRKLRK